MTRILNLFRKRKLFKKLHTRDGHLATIHVEKTPHLMTDSMYYIKVYSKEKTKHIIHMKAVTGDLLAIALVREWTIAKLKPA